MQRSYKALSIFIDNPDGVFVYSFQWFSVSHALLGSIRRNGARIGILRIRCNY
jgi:hypothetical protein